MTRMVPVMMPAWVADRIGACVQFEYTGEMTLHWHKGTPGVLVMPDSPCKCCGAKTVKRITSQT